MLTISESLPLSKPAAELGLPLICYHNHFSDGSVSASSAQGAHPAEMAIDPFTATAWIGEEGEGEWWIRVQKPNADANYAAVTGWRGDQSLGSGAIPASLTGVSVRLQYSDDGGETWEDAAGPVEPNDRVAGFLFETANHEDWRFLFEADAPPEIVNVSLGIATEMDAGFTSGFQPPRQARNNQILNNNTDQGHLIGRSVIRRGISTSLDVENVDEAWVRNVWEPLADHLETRAAYVIWNPVRWPDEIAYVWPSRDLRAPSYTSNAGWMRVRVDVEGIA